MRDDIKRYRINKGDVKAKFDPETGNGYVVAHSLGAEEAEGGEYVKYADHKAATDAIDKQIVAAVSSDGQWAVMAHPDAPAVYIQVHEGRWVLRNIAFPENTDGK